MTPKKPKYPLVEVLETEDGKEATITRARGLAALILGLGRIERGRVVVEAADRAAADTYWREACA